VLFLDELAEFRREVLDQLRQPLEEGEVRLSRARHSCRFPCRITLVAATNPCPCGWSTEPDRHCRCGEGLRRRYWARLSGPLLDRLDLQVVMRRCPSHELAGAYRQADASEQPCPESSAVVAARVRAARRRMARRNPGRCANGLLPAGLLASSLDLEPGALGLWERAIEHRQLSARSGARILRVARTISDLEDRNSLGPAAIAEALSFRSFDGVSSGA
jgi:magnesium chelatase family protein